LPEVNERVDCASFDIALLLEHTDEIESVKGQLLHEQEQMETAVAELEEQLQQMSKQTSLRDGRINVAHRTSQQEAPRHGARANAGSH
jgi:chromosome segregation ATPase